MVQNDWRVASNCIDGDCRAVSLNPLSPRFLHCHGVRDGISVNFLVAIQLELVDAVVRIRELIRVCSDRPSLGSTDLR